MAPVDVVTVAMEVHVAVLSTMRQGSVTVKAPVVAFQSGSRAAVRPLFVVPLINSEETVFPLVVTTPERVLCTKTILGNVPLAIYTWDSPIESPLMRTAIASKAPAAFANST